VKRSVFDKIGFFDEGLLIGEDYDMMRKFVRHDLVMCHLKESLYLRRLNRQSLSKSYSQKKAENLFEILERYTKTFEHNELFPDTDWSQIAPGKERLYAKCLTAETFIEIGKTYLNSKDTHAYAYIAFEKAKQEYEKCLEMEPENPFIQKIVQQFVLDKVRIDEDKMQTIS
jgi:tetratricopeptide (TPR) repeat protein